MCVPISFTSWWITSSMQQSGLSSATAEFDADRLSLWELVWRSACPDIKACVTTTAERRVKRWLLLLYTAPSQECPSPPGCCRCARWCNWRRFHRGRCYCGGGSVQVSRGSSTNNMAQVFLTQSSAVRWASLPALNSLLLWWWTGPPSSAGWTNPLKERRSHALMHHG